jgi:hypothetical protein
MYRITSPNSLFLIGRMHEILDILDLIGRDYVYLIDYIADHCNTKTTDSPGLSSQPHQRP